MNLHWKIKKQINIIKNDNEFLKVLNNPQINSDEKLNVLQTAFKDNVSEEIINFFKVVFHKNREGYLLEMLEVFMEDVKEFNGITTANIVSAKPLSSSQLDRIKESLSKKLNKQVLIEAVVDPQVIGGLKISVDGHLIDNTLKRQINDLKGMLKDIKLASKGV